MDESLIVVSIVSGLFTLAGISLLNHNWFKRESFKFDISFDRKKHDLELKKMARDMGLTSPTKSSIASTQDRAPSSILDFAKNLHPDQIAAIAEILTGQPTEDQVAGGIMPDGMEGLIDFATKNPDVVKSFLSGLTKGKEGGDDFGAGGL